MNSPVVLIVRIVLLGIELSPTGSLVFVRRMMPGRNRNKTFQISI